MPPSTSPEKASRPGVTGITMVCAGLLGLSFVYELLMSFVLPIFHFGAMVITPSEVAWFVVTFAVITVVCHVTTTVWGAPLLAIMDRRAPAVAAKFDQIGRLTGGGSVDTSADKAAANATDVKPVAKPARAVTGVRPVASGSRDAR